MRTRARPSLRSGKGVGEDFWRADLALDTALELNTLGGQLGLQSTQRISWALRELHPVQDEVAREPLRDARDQVTIARSTAYRAAHSQ